MSVSPDEARFWPKIIKGRRENDCWLWTGAVGDDGYGRYWIKTASAQQALRPQRFAYLLLTGEHLPADIKLLHTCDIPLCVRATGGKDSHLYPGTQADNLRDRSQKRRHANAHTWRWRGTGRTNFAAQSRQLRDALKEHGWDESVIRPLMSGHDPNAPTLF
ncbi:hypothetical protein [Arthrobacter sp. VKM Ac-2550]|uniref:hypothetical protein n=1 Tax=Crystallibacter permensis TaxID=1938888 RepID=UPI0022270965|nr:hypothetical protein [Arthrobacter sp. VKM Ac-2550]MCW2133361.1 hypothetical protein [Arthrobacter sp. VKM Ac-2550]